MSVKILVRIRKCLILVIIQLVIIILIQINEWLVRWKMKQLVLQLKNLLDRSHRCIHHLDNSEYKQPMDVNKNVVATISHNQYKDVLLNNKCLRHSMYRIQSKDYRIGTYEINKFSLPSFDGKYIIRINYKKTVILITIWKSFFVKLQYNQSRLFWLFLF